MSALYLNIVKVSFLFVLIACAWFRVPVGTLATWPTDHSGIWKGTNFFKSTNQPARTTGTTTTTASARASTSTNASAVTCRVLVLLPMLLLMRLQVQVLMLLPVLVVVPQQLSKLACNP
jgi:hypothetical protein